MSRDHADTGQGEDGRSGRGKRDALAAFGRRSSSTELSLRDGMILFVPKTAKRVGTLAVGVWVHGYVAKSEKGQNVVQWLEVEGATGQR